jgi:hypothetical protein
MRHLVSWPRLLSLLSAAFGVAGSLFVALRAYYGGLPPWEAADIALLSGAAGFGVLSIFLWLARPWARRTLIGLLLCIVVALLGGGMLHDAFFAEAPLYIAYTATLLFAIGVVCHRDVAESFSGTPRRSERDLPDT